MGPQNTVPQPAPDSQLIDRIVYLASQASETRAVDPILDALRAVTANTGPDKILSPEDHARLLETEAKLKHYLIYEDPVRLFTEETLNKKLDERFGGGAHAPGHGDGVKVGVIFGVALVAYFLSVALAPRSLAAGTRFLAAAPVFVAFLNGTITWFFWTGRGAFKAEIKRAYVNFCWAVLVAAIGSIQFPLLFAFPHLAHIELFRYAGFFPPFVISCFFFYLGLRRYARQVGVTSWVLSVRWVAACSVVFVLALLLLPRPSSVHQFAAYMLSLASIGLSGLLSLFGAWLGFVTVRRVTARYASGIRMLAISEALQVLACVGLCGAVFMQGAVSGLTLGIVSSPFSIVAFLQLLSAFILKRNTQS